MKASRLCWLVSLAVALVLGTSVTAWATLMSAPVAAAFYHFDPTTITGVSNGQALTSWADSSGNGRDVSQANSDNAPKYYTNVRNGMPSVRLENGKYLSRAGDLLGAGEGGQVNVFSVQEKNYGSGGSFTAIFGQWDAAGSNRRWAGGLSWSESYQAILSSSDGTSVGSQEATGSPGAPHVNQIWWDMNGGPRGIRADGSSVDQNGTSTIYNSGTNPDFTIGVPSEGANADLYEVVLFNRPVNTAERKIMENYLGSKWDVAVGSDSLYAGKTAENGNYDYHVIGIGKEDDGANTLSGAAGLTVSESNSSLSIGEYLMAGEKAATNSLVGTLLPEGEGVVSRWERVWAVTKTGSLDATLAFDFSEGGLAPPSAGAAFALLYSSTDGGTFSWLSNLSASVAGDTVSFNVLNANLADGYYTLGIIPEPGTLTLLGCGLVGLVAYAWRKRR